MALDVWINTRINKVVDGDPEITITALDKLYGDYRPARDYSADRTGATDAYLAIQTAIWDAADAGGGRIVFNPGDIHLIQTGLLHQNRAGAYADYVSYVVEGTGATLGSGAACELRTDVAGLTILTIGGSTETSTKAGVIRGLGFSAWNTARSDVSTRGVSITNVSGWKLYDVSVRNFWASDGISFSGIGDFCDYHEIYNLRGYENLRDVALYGAATDIKMFGGALNGGTNVGDPTVERSQTPSSAIYCEKSRPRRIGVYGLTSTNKDIHLDLGCVSNSTIEAICENNGSYADTGVACIVRGGYYKSVTVDTVPAYVLPAAVTLKAAGGATVGAAIIHWTTATSVVFSVVDPDFTGVSGSYFDHATLGDSTMTATPLALTVGSNNTIDLKGINLQGVIELDHPECENNDVTVKHQDMRPAEVLTAIGGTYSVVSGQSTIVPASTTVFGSRVGDKLRFAADGAHGYRAYKVATVTGTAVSHLLQFTEPFSGPTQVGATLSRVDDVFVVRDFGTRTSINGDASNVSIAAYGARGDGVDDTVAIRQAILDAWQRDPVTGAERRKESRNVHIPPGEYWFNDTLFIPPYVKLKGNGRGRSMLSTLAGFNYGTALSEKAANSIPTGIDATKYTCNSAAVVIGDFPFDDFKNMAYGTITGDKITSTVSTGTLSYEIYGHPFASNDTIYFGGANSVTVDGLALGRLNYRRGYKVTVTDVNNFTIDMNSRTEDLAEEYTAITANVSFATGDFGIAGESMRWRYSRREIAYSAGLVDVHIGGLEGGLEPQETVGVYSRIMQEDAGLVGVTVSRFSRFACWIEADVTGASFPQNYVIENCGFQLASTGTGGTQVNPLAALRLDGSSGARGASDLTLNVESGTDLANSVGLLLAGNMKGFYYKLNCENVHYGVQLGLYGGLPRGGSKLGPVTIERIDGGSSSTHDLIHITPPASTADANDGVRDSLFDGGAPLTSQRITILGASPTGASNSTIYDGINGNTIYNAGNQGTSLYIMDDLDRVFTTEEGFSSKLHGLEVKNLVLTPQSISVEDLSLGIGDGIDGTPSGIVRVTTPGSITDMDTVVAPTEVSDGNMLFLLFDDDFVEIDFSGSGNMRWADPQGYSLLTPKAGDIVMAVWDSTDSKWDCSYLSQQAPALGGSEDQTIDASGDITIGYPAKSTIYLGGFGDAADTLVGVDFTSSSRKPRYGHLLWLRAASGATEPITINSSADFKLAGGTSITLSADYHNILFAWDSLDSVFIEVSRSLAS
jgi:hypothetical protein